MIDNEKVEDGAAKLPVPDLRDWFAGQALSAFAECKTASEAARSAYAYADAMIVFRRGNGLRS